MRQRLEERSRADDGRALNPRGDHRLELDLRSRCFGLGLETLLAASRTGSGRLRITTCRGGAKKDGQPQFQVYT